jgi:hypothetical protein
MTLPVSGPISLLDIQAEFGGPANPISLSNYYKNGPYVTVLSYAPNVPTSGPIALSNFYGARKLSLYTFTYTSSDTLVLPYSFAGNLIIDSLLGGGGGSGGYDASGSGYSGYPGQLITNGTVSASPGDTVNIYIGGGGTNGGSGGGVAGGTGGLSVDGFSGGDGGRSGYQGSSGSGGGGGAASAIAVNMTLVAVAAGGGGGGGSGYYSRGRPNLDNPGTNGATVGGHGQNKNGDGGGGGGGGGGYNGGVGGATVGGDDGARSGENGNNLIPLGAAVTSGNNSGTGGSATISYYA